MPIPLAYVGAYIKVPLGNSSVVIIATLFHTTSARKNARESLHRDTRLSDERIRLRAHARFASGNPRIRARAIGRRSRRLAAEHVFGAREGSRKGVFAT